MIVDIFNYFRLVLRLLLDKRVKPSLKSLIMVPVIYFFLPFPDDFIHLLGFIDDMFILLIASIIFVFACPKSVVLEHRAFLNGIYTTETFNFEKYRYQSETRNLALAFISIIISLLIFGYFAGILFILFLVYSYSITNLKRKEILANAVKTGPKQFPEIYEDLQKVRKILGPGKINLLIIQRPEMNAWTFGYSEPYTIVLTSGLVEKLSHDEIRAVIGHEVGHILFGHVNIINIVSAPTILGNLFFYKWSRSCEYSADTIALIASNGNYLPVVSALLKLASGLPDSINIEEFLSQLEKDDNLPSLEIFASHPYINNRIRNLIYLAGQDGFKKSVEDKRDSLDSS